MPAYPRALPLPFPLVDPVGAVLSALGRALTGGVQSVAGWAFGRMTAALLATTRVRLDG